jgi:tripartite-type tricarboxylate transporter receptor subunit TctC
MLPAAVRIARAESYPSRPVRLIVGFPAGGLTDILARLLAPPLSERLRQQFIYADRKHCPYPLLMEVNPSFPAKTVPDFIAYAKANPGKINMATAGIGSSVHLAGELFMTMTGVQLVPVHYRTSYVPDMLAGQVQVVFTTIEQVRAGKLRAVAVTSGTRSPALPDVPTIGEFVPGYEASVWNGIVAPKSTPAEIIGKLYKEIDATLADPKIMARFADIGSVPKSMTPVDFGKFISEDTEKWGKVIHTANIKPE